MAARPARRRKPGHLLQLALLAGMGLPVQAEPEAWQAVDVQIPLRDPGDQLLLPDALRVFTIAQEAPRFDGLGLLRFSAGPLWQLNQGLSLGLFGDLIALPAPAGKPTQELRLNFEPLWKGRLNEHIGWIERPRLEYRHLPAQQSLRMRNLLRLNWLWSKDSLAFISDEVFVEFPGGFNQNRAMIGLGYEIAPNTQLELAYLVRARKGAQDRWELDHILTLFLFFAPECRS